MLDELPAAGWGQPAAVAIGNFDGVHLGHRKLIETAVAEARGLGGLAVVLTFNPHPLQLLAPDRFPGLLLDGEEKARQIARWGADLLVRCPFTPELAALEPRAFALEVLRERMRPQVVVVGFNFSFGRGGRGNPEMLEELGAEAGFRVLVLPPVAVDGETVSSSAIREALERGDVPRAARLLGYWPLLNGRVVSGEGRGRLLGFPTANLAVAPGVVLPAGGVYAARTEVDGRPYAVALNLGRRPTFGDGLPPTVEAFLLDFQGDLYGRWLRLEVRQRLRPERRFPDARALAEQLARDVEAVSRLISVSG